jgi:hypothetical protein
MLVGTVTFIVALAFVAFFIAPPLVLVLAVYVAAAVRQVAQLASAVSGVVGVLLLRNGMREARQYIERFQLYQQFNYISHNLIARELRTSIGQPVQKLGPVLAKLK